MLLVLTTLWSQNQPQKAATRGGIRSQRGGIHRQREEDVNVVHRKRGMEFLLCMQRVGTSYHARDASALLHRLQSTAAIRYPLLVFLFNRYVVLLHF
ncbi:hypothetical protein CDAR_468501 [Caerostris darwini]|uniref:Uncharacterized protein n=1 Tax=Caerostris darwini TaxID=1538125 RepID=A0AAV4Q3M1_9ARAC|nr:hypothetical protein CDAR_468501 [Caerostris darwini]